jgi:hypothetical protein
MHDRDIYNRETRISRAHREVVPNYTIAEAPSSDTSRACFTVASKHAGKSSSRYLVTLSREWSRPPSCTCPDSIQRSAVLGGYCKHVIAVLLTSGEYRCQLLELFLKGD